MKKEITDHINTLNQFNEYLYSQGHTFWHCASTDKEKGINFYYVSINRVKHMSTCAACGQIIDNNRKIKKLQNNLQSQK